MKFDKNSVIGFVLLAGLFLGYFYFTRVGQLELEEKQKQIRDSLAAIQPVIKDTAAAKLSNFLFSNGTFSTIFFNLKTNLCKTV